MKVPGVDHGNSRFASQPVSPVPGNPQEDVHIDSAFGVGDSLRDDGGQRGSQGPLGFFTFHPAVTLNASGAHSTFHKDLNSSLASREDDRVYQASSASLFPTRSFEAETLHLGGLKVSAPCRQHPMEVEYSGEEHWLCT